MSWADDLKAARGRDPDAAARVLVHAAGFMRRGEALPGPLAEYIAGAFEGAARKKERKARADALANNLFIFGREGRPGVGPAPAEIWAELTSSDAEQYPTRRRAAAAMAERFGVSETTARNRLDIAAAEVVERENREFMEWLATATPEQVADWLKG